MFIGRTSELQELQSLYNTEGFQMPIIYGRRRVGKSTLIRHFIEMNPDPAICFTAIESTTQKNLDLFSKCIYKALAPQLNKLPAFSSFEDAFDFITEYALKQRIILFIDEYPYLASSEKSISSRLQNYIDNDWKNSQLFLILCGSSMSFMEHQVLGYQSPLYGRRTAQFKIKPFSYLDSSLFAPAYSDEDKALMYGVTGGIPKYLELFSSSKSIYENIIQLFFQESGFLFEEPSNLLKQELRDVTTYNAIIEAIASGASKINEIVGKVHCDSATISYCLKSLIEIGIVEKQYAITEETNKKKTYYSICDTMFRFWYRYVPNGIDLIQIKEGASYFEEIVKPSLSDFMGSIFEEMCKTYLLFSSLRNELPMHITKIGRWWGTNPSTKQEEEIDIVGINPSSKTMLLGECKYQNQGIHLQTVEKLLSRGNLLNAYPIKYYCLCSKNSFTQDAIDKANEHQIKMITLHDLYHNQ